MEKPLVEKIEEVVKELQEKGEEPTSYRVAKILGISESTVYYHWKTRENVVTTPKNLFDNQFKQLKKILKSLNRNLLEFQKVLKELELELDVVTTSMENEEEDKNVVTTPKDVEKQEDTQKEDVVTTKPMWLPHSYININNNKNINNKQESKKQDQDYGKNDSSSHREEDKSVVGFKNTFRQYYKKFYNQVYARGGYTRKESSQIRRLIKTLAKEGLSWRKYLDWCFSVKATRNGHKSVLTIGLITCKSFVDEFILQYNGSDIPDWVKKKEKRK